MVHNLLLYTCMFISMGFIAIIVNGKDNLKMYALLKLTWYGIQHFQHKTLSSETLQ